jgi:hypothetical protein
LTPEGVALPGLRFTVAHRSRPSAIRGDESRGTAPVVETFDSTTSKASTMSEPREDEILRKAKELCRCDGKTWSLDDFENGVAGVTMPTVVADDNDRTEYLNRAGALLKEE